MKGHRWGPWEQRSPQQLLNATTVLVVRLYQTTRQRLYLRSWRYYRNAWQIAVKLQNVSNTWCHLKEFRNFQKLPRQWFPVGGSTFWRTLWDTYNQWEDCQWSWPRRMIHLGMILGLFHKRITVQICSFNKWEKLGKKMIIWRVFIRYRFNYYKLLE